MNNATPAWSELSRFGDAEEIEISTRRPDGSLRPFVPIWVVAVGGSLYVRSYRGAAGVWYRRATQLSAGAGPRLRPPGRGRHPAPRPRALTLRSKGTRS